MATAQVDAIRASISQTPPYCFGTVPLSPLDALLFYKQGSQASWIDLSQATDSDLEALARACEPATFGVNQRDVLDESYRKAGKIDRQNFSTNFDIVQADLARRIRSQLMTGSDELKPINIELYKLNVYGTGSFFKAHKDTPRSEAMFGSLVVVFPTRHEGGSLLLRHGDKEWTFDSAASTNSDGGPAVAYTAFYGDVEHEVTPVKSGYRVTLTYNLYFASDRPLPPLTAAAPDDHALEVALSGALKDPSFLPTGGTLGFGLSFMYPVSSGKKKFRALEKNLKGSDAVIKRVCDRLSLGASLKAIYRDNGFSIMVDKIVDINGWHIDSEFIEVLCGDFDGKIIHGVGTAPLPPGKGFYIEDNEIVEVLWITPLNKHAHFESP